MKYLKIGNKFFLIILTIILAASQLNAITADIKNCLKSENNDKKSFFSPKAAILTFFGISGIAILYYILYEKDINKEDKRGFTPLTMACYSGNIDKVKKILNHPKFNKASNFNNGTPLIMACFHGHIEIVKLLIEYGADVNQEDCNGVCPLEEACLNGHVEVVKELLKHPKIDVNKTDIAFGTPLMISCYLSNKKDGATIAEELLKIENLDINKVDRTGCNALYYAVLCKNIKIINLLHAKGASIEMLPDNRKLEYQQNINQLFEEMRKQLNR